MFSSIFKSKKNIISYIVSIMLSLGCTFYGGNPFAVAAFGSLTSLQIPTIIPFIFSSIIIFFKDGTSELLSYIITTILFAVFVSIESDKTLESNTNNKSPNNIFKFAISNIIANVFLILIGSIAIANIGTAILNVLISIILFIIFTHGLPVLYSISFKSSMVFSLEELIAGAITLMCTFSFTNTYSFYGYTIYSFVCILALTLLSWHRKISKAVLISIFMWLVNGLFGDNSTTILVIYLCVAIMTSVLSRAKRKGAFAGVVIALAMFFIYSSVDPKNSGDTRMQIEYYTLMLQNYDKVSNENFNTFISGDNSKQNIVIINDRISKNIDISPSENINDSARQDTNEKANDNTEQSVSGDFQIYLSKEDIEHGLEKLKKASEPSSSCIIFTELIVCYFIIFCMPDNFFKNGIFEFDNFMSLKDTRRKYLQKISGYLPVKK